MFFFHRNLFSRRVWDTLVLTCDRVLTGWLPPTSFHNEKKIDILLNKLSGKSDDVGKFTNCFYCCLNIFPCFWLCSETQLLLLSLDNQIEKPLMKLPSLTRKYNRMYVCTSIFPQFLRKRKQKMPFTVSAMPKLQG